MSVALPGLAAALSRLGPAEVFVGDCMTSGQMTSLGTLEGERRAEVEYTENKLTLPEQTAGISHDTRKNVNRAQVHCSIVLNAATASTWLKINPLGLNGGGSSRFKAAITTSVLLVPHSELGGALAYTGGQWVRTAGNGYAGVSGSGAAPVHSIWLWKASVMFGPNIPFTFDNGGKTLVPVVFEAMLDATKPDDAMVYYIGDPRAFSTPITVTP